MTALNKQDTLECLPYEKLQKYGAEHLTDGELLAVILRTGTKNQTALDLGKSVLHHMNGEQYGLLGLHYMSLEQLQKIPGIGEVKAVQLKCIAEIAVRMAKKNAQKGLSFQKASSIADYYMENMRHRRTECVLLLMLNMKGRLLGEKILSTGTVNSSMLSPREVFLEAVLHDAANLILLHNHPSGDSRPSKQDVEITKTLHELGVMMNLPILDHIIIGDHQYFSFKESGYL